MTGMVLLDICIAVLFVILVFSIIASAVAEVAAGIFKWRAHGLVLGVARLLGPAFEDFWNQPLIDSLRGPKAKWRDVMFWKPPTVPQRREDKRDPSYLPPNLFAKELLVLTGLDGLSPPEIVAEIRRRAENRPATRPPDRGTAADTLAGRLHDVEDRLRRVMVDVVGDVQESERAVANWFDESMQRISGWYVRRTKLVLFIVGLLMAGILNVNLFGYAKTLMEDDRLRSQAVAAAETAGAALDLEAFRAELLGAAAGEAAETEAGLADTAGEDTAGAVTGADPAVAAAPSGDGAATRPEGDAADLQATAEALSSLMATMRETLEPAGVAMGWGDDPGAGLSLAGVLSWVVLAFAVTLGAQVWFDLLQTFVKVRAAGVGLAGKRSPAIVRDERRDAAAGGGQGGGGQGGGGQGGGGGGGSSSGTTG